MTIKRKISLALGAVTVLLAAVTYLVILPVINEITAIVQAIHREREDLEVKYRRGQQIRKITTEFKKIQDDLGRLNAIYLPTGRELDFITTLEALAHRQQLKLDKTTPLATTFLSEDAPLPLTLTLGGSYPQVIRFLLEVERLDLYFNVQQLSIRGSNPQTGDVTAVITGQAFRRAYQATRADTAPPPSAERPAPGEARPAPADTL